MVAVDPITSLAEGAEFQGRNHRYLSLGELRRGGMGVILLACRLSDEKKMVIKVALRSEPQAAARLEQEIRALRSLDHPRVVKVQDDGIYDGRLWYAMDHVGPCNLADLLVVRAASGPGDMATLVAGIVDGSLPQQPQHLRVGLPTLTAVSILAAVADVVAHAHGRGVIHRDLKPANILLNDSGDPILCDFGVARAMDIDLHLTAQDEVVGTMDYLAPEQLTGSAPDERADVYSLGAMLYECLTGAPPPRRRHRLDRLRALRRVPRPLAAVCYHALELNPQRRMHSAQAMTADLNRFIDGETVLAPQPSLWAYGIHWLNHRPLSVGVAAAILLVLAIMI